MTDEEITALQQALDNANTNIAELTAERDSLREELETTRTRNTELVTENAETKKLNYTLARQLDARPKETFDDALLNMFGKRGHK